MIDAFVLSGFLFYAHTSKIVTALWSRRPSPQVTPALVLLIHTYNLAVLTGL